VQARPRKVQVYAASEEHYPFDEWLGKMRDQKARAAIEVRIDRIAEGNLGDHKPVGEGVQELRIDVGQGYRVYFAEDGPHIVLLLCGGSKLGQRRDIKTAIRYWREYKS
jgi:putative addiction module killer protein